MTSSFRPHNTSSNQHQWNPDLKLVIFLFSWRTNLKLAEFLISKKCESTQNNLSVFKSELILSHTNTYYFYYAKVVKGIFRTERSLWTPQYGYSIASKFNNNVFLKENSYDLTKTTALSFSLYMNQIFPKINLFTWLCCPIQAARRFCNVH